MAARAIWKGVIRFQDFRLPVRLFSAAVDRTVHFNLLHAADLVRVRQRLVDPETGETFDYQEARRGREVESGVFVVLREEELAKAEPQPSRDIDIVCFLEPEVIRHQWYVRPYYLGPDGEEATYFALARALKQEQLEGLARWTFRRKEYVGALRSEDDALMLLTLRHAGAVVPASELEPPGGRPFQAKERDMAEKLLQTLDDEFRPQDFHDQYRQRLLDLIEAKRKGEQWEIEEREPEREEGESLADALEASLAGRK